jgi:hypothetical protein
MKPKKKVKHVKHPVKKTARRSPKKIVKRKVLKPKRKTMTNPDEKKPSEAAKGDEKKPEVTPYAHKNPPIGPATTKPLPDWRKDRDYENFNPTAEK